MSEAELEAEADEAEADDEAEEEEREPTFYEKVQAVIDEGRITEVREMDPEDRSEVEAEAVKVKDLENDHELAVDELDDTQATHDELDRLYNEEGLSLVNIGRLFRTTDATIQRRMEQHGLPRRGSRNEIPEEDLLEAYVDLACEMNGADTADDLADLVEAGEAHLPTTTEMGEQGPHSAHTYYNFFDGWSDVQASVLEHIGAEPPEEEPEDSEE